MTYIPKYFLFFLYLFLLARAVITVEKREASAGKKHLCTPLIRGLSPPPAGGFSSPLVRDNFYIHAAKGELFFKKKRKKSMNVELKVTFLKIIVYLIF